MGNSKSEPKFACPCSPIIVDVNGKIYKNVSPSNVNNINYNKPYTNNAFSKTYNDHKSHPNSEKTQNIFHEPLKLAHNDTINSQSKFVTETCVNKEKCNNEDQTSDLKNKFAIAPDAISTKDDFMTKWFSWKNEFLTYMKSFDQAEEHKQKWGIMLLNRMGPIGQEIYRSFTFNKDHAETDIDALLKQFDIYCIFGGRRRGDDEDIDEYVNNLMVMVSKHMTNTHEMVKEKILMEIDKDKFTTKAENLILGFSFPSSIQLLTVKEITYIWMLYENVSFKRSEEIHNFLVKNCNNCGRTHKINNCYARGKICNKCGTKNHYWTRCPSQFIDNCVYCGEGHFVRDCPAYLNECYICNRTNHFSWKCKISKVLNCNFCGLSHIASKSACSAVNTICMICGKRGHVPSKCHKKSRYH